VGRHHLKSSHSGNWVRIVNHPRKLGYPAAPLAFDQNGRSGSSREPSGQIRDSGQSWRIE
jgi:hypothetical protein